LALSTKFNVVKEFRQSPAASNSLLAFADRFGPSLAFFLQMLIMLIYIINLDNLYQPLLAFLAFSTNVAQTCQGLC